MQPCKQIWHGNQKYILENDTAKASNKRNHLGNRWKKMKAHIFKPPPPKAPDKRQHVGDKRRDMQADPLQSHSAKTSTKRHHAGDKCKMSRNESIVEQNDPAKGDKQRNNAEPIAKWSSHSHCIQRKIRARHPAEQSLTTRQFIYGACRTLWLPMLCSNSSCKSADVLEDVTLHNVKHQLARKEMGVQKEGSTTTSVCEQKPVKRRRAV